MRLAARTSVSSPPSLSSAPWRVHSMAVAIRRLLVLFIEIIFVQFFKLNCPCLIARRHCVQSSNPKKSPPWGAHADGSVDGSIQVRGGLPRYGRMPLGTLRVCGDRVCAYLPGSTMQPCFYLERTNDNSFRGSIAGLSFAYCDFTRYQGRADVDQPARHGPLSLTADK